LWDIELDFWTGNVLIGRMQRADVIGSGSDNVVLNQCLP